MAKFTNPLDNLKIAAPCSADWNEMNGSERARFCASCQLNVYNLSAMTRSEAEKLIIETEGNLCLRFYRRADGTVLTQNCPTGLKALKRRAMQSATAVFAVALSFLTGIGLSNTASYLEARIFSVSGIEVAPVKIETEPLAGTEPEPVANGRIMMGEFSVEEGRPSINYSETKGRLKFLKNLANR